MNNTLDGLVKQGIRLSFWWSSLGRTTQWRIVIAGLGICILTWLILAEKPWVVAQEINRRMFSRHYAAIYSWWAALLNLFFLGALAALCPWWTGAAQGPILNSKFSTLNPRWFWPCVFGAMLLAACFSFPRMNHSLWDDEELTVRYSILGRFQRNMTTGKVSFRKVNWQDTLYDYRTPNNHVLHSILARFSLDLWRAVTKPQGLPFAEWVLRVPAFLFGLLSIAALAWFLKECSLAAAGAMAAFLLAMHPWYVRYMTEARGYSMILFFGTVLLVFWLRAISRGEWKWWIAYGVTQALMIYTYPGVLFTLIVLNALTVPLLAFSKDCATPFAAQSGRWFCVNSFAAMAVLQLMMPLYPQLKHYLNSESARNVVLGWPWVQNALCFLFGGVPWTKHGTPTRDYPEFLGTIQHHPEFFYLSVSLTGVMVILGMAWFFCKNWQMAVIALSVVVPPVMIFAASRMGGYIIYESYVISALPGLVAFTATGLVMSAIAARRLPLGRFLAPALVLTMIFGYFFYTAPFRSWLVSHPLQPIRDSVLISRGYLDPLSEENDEVLTASFCIPPYLYDAHMHRLDSADQFIEMLKRADREGKTLYLNIGMPWSARQYSPKMWAMFNDSHLFEEHTHLRGFEPSLDRIVAKYKAGGAQRFNFSAYEGKSR